MPAKLYKNPTLHGCSTSLPELSNWSAGRSHRPYTQAQGRRVESANVATQWHATATAGTGTSTGPSTSIGTGTAASGSTSAAANLSIADSLQGGLQNRDGDRNRRHRAPTFLLSSTMHPNSSCPVPTAKTRFRLHSLKIRSRRTHNRRHSCLQTYSQQVRTIGEAAC